VTRHGLNDIRPPDIVLDITQLLVMQPEKNLSLCKAPHIWTISRTSRMVIRYRFGTMPSCDQRESKTAKLDMESGVPLPRTGHHRPGVFANYDFGSGDDGVSCHQGCPPLPARGCTLPATAVVQQIKRPAPPPVPAASDVPPARVQPQAVLTRPRCPVVASHGAASSCQTLS
jgi:hypothetical protein